MDPRPPARKLDRSSRTRQTALACCILAVFALPVLVISRGPHGKNHWPVPEAEKKRPNPVPGTPEAIESVRPIFVDKCVQCHGDTGKGDGPMAPMQDVEPANFQDAKMMNAMTDGEIFYKISEGREPMPSYKVQLSETDRWKLVHLIRTFSRPAPKPQPQAKATPAKNSKPKKQN